MSPSYSAPLSRLAISERMILGRPYTCARLTNKSGASCGILSRPAQVTPIWAVPALRLKAVSRLWSRPAGLSSYTVTTNHHSYLDQLAGPPELIDRTTRRYEVARTAEARS